MRGTAVCSTILMVFLVVAILGLTAGTAAAVSCVPPPSGLVSWWGGDNNALDMVGGNNGTPLNGAAYAPGMVGQAFSFDGADDYFNVPYNLSLDLQSSLTLAAWINSTNNSSVNRAIVGKAGGYQIYVEAGGLLVFGFYNGAQWTLLHSLITVPENVWVHVAGTFNSANGNLELYINGVLNTSVATVNRLSTNTNSLMIGGFGINGAPFNGLIDEIEIFNRALLAGEVAAIYDAGSAGICRPCTSPPPGMVSWWGGDNNALDLIGTNNGTLMDGAAYDTGMVGQAFKLNGSSSFVEVNASPSLDVGTSAGFTLDAWIYPHDVATLQPLFEWNSGSESGYGAHFWIGDVGANEPGSLYANIIDTSSQSAHNFWTAGNILQANAYQHVALTYDYASGNAALYLNGAAAANQNLGSLIAQTSYDFYIGLRPGFYFNGLIDEVEMFNRALSADEIAAIYNSFGVGKCFSPLSPAASAPGGNGTISCAVPLIKGNSTVCTITPDMGLSAGYYLSALSDNSVNVLGSAIYGAPSSTYAIGNVLAAHTVTATFTEGLVRRVATVPKAYHRSIQDAYDNLQPSETIEAQASLSENGLDMSTAAVTLTGGFGSGFSQPNPGDITKVTGSLIIGGTGKVTLSNIVVSQ